MRKIELFLLAGLAAGALTPGLALASEKHDVQIDITAPGPRDILAQAQRHIQAGNLAAATTAIEQAENRVIVDSNADNAFVTGNDTAMLEAVPLLDTARQALSRGDAAAAGTALTSAQQLL